MGQIRLKAAGAGYDLVRWPLPQVNHHLEITRGVLAQPCLELLQVYFKLKRVEDTGGS